MSTRGRAALLTFISFLVTAVLEAETQRFALLIGIDDYRAPRAAFKAESDGNRDFTNLTGAVNDVEVMRNLLISIYDFKETEIVVVKNQAAKRNAIFAAIDDLVRRARTGDVVLFYFSGHGSQVRNSFSDEDDKLDESLVPADIRAGAPDIRDKELRRRFQPLLARRARLTIILDSCHSGSGVRGFPPDGPVRIASPDLRDVKDDYRGPKLEDGGALILSAARDTDLAFEGPGYQNKRQGAFSWAWTRAVRDAGVNEPALETFRRAAARMQLEWPGQVPVIAGNSEARLTPFLGTRVDRKDHRVTVAVRSVRRGLIAIDGGWANGLTEGSELRPVSDPPSPARLRVVGLNGVTASTATIISGAADSVHSGSLLELVAWAPPEGQRLRIWVPRGSASVFVKANVARAPRLSDDPTLSPAIVLRWTGRTWQLCDPFHRRIANVDPSSMEFPRDKPLFVQLPATREIAAHLGRVDGIERVRRPEDADYILVGRNHAGRTEYAWARPAADVRDADQSPLPIRTDWHSGKTATELTTILNEDLRRLLRIHLWHSLPSPPESQFRYRLAVRRDRDGTAIANGNVVEEELYNLGLRADAQSPAHSGSRFIYVFMVDTFGKSVLLFPRGPTGSIENHYPRVDTQPAEIRLNASFIPEPPYGTDTYFLLTTDQALTDPWVLEWDGVRTRELKGETAFERLLLRRMSNDRGARPGSAPSRWSIERLSLTATKATDAPIKREASR